MGADPGQSGASGDELAERELALLSTMSSFCSSSSLLVSGSPSASELEPASASVLVPLAVMSTSGVGAPGWPDSGRGMMLFELPPLPLETSPKMLVWTEIGLMLVLRDTSEKMLA